MMPAKIAIFEDDLWAAFAPLSYTAALFDIKTACRSILESYEEPPSTLLVRDSLRDVTAERHPDFEVNPAKIDDDTIFVHSAVLPSSIEASHLNEMRRTFAIAADDRVLVARLSASDREKVAASASAGKRVKPKSLRVDKVISHEGSKNPPKILLRPWELIKDLEHRLSSQIGALVERPESNYDWYNGPDAAKARGIVVRGESGALVSRSAVLEEGTVLDCSKGPVLIQKGAKISPSRIVGPAFISEGTQVKQFSVLASCYVGRECRIAGEVEDSIVCDYSNKAHTGFLGHSYVGSWTNIGAMTTTSDLKMTYGDIKMTSAGAKINTGMNKLGSFFGDMVKTSIGCLIYSGSLIGVSSHLHGLVSGDVPSFTIAGKSIGASDVELRLDSAIETQRKMMARRSIAMSMAYEAMITRVFRDTAAERRDAGVRKAKFASP